MVPVQSIADLYSNVRQLLLYVKVTSGTHMFWVFCNSVTNSLFYALQILVKEALIFEKHCKQPLSTAHLSIG